MAQGAASLLLEDVNTFAQLVEEFDVNHELFEVMSCPPSLSCDGIEDGNADPGIEMHSCSRLLNDSESQCIHVVIDTKTDTVEQ